VVVGKVKPGSYVPTLRGKTGELDALARLSPLAKDCTTPVIDIPKPPDLSTTETFEKIAEKVTLIRDIWGTAHSLYIDLSRFGSNESADGRPHPVIKTFELARQCRLRAIPVCGTTLTRGPGTEYIDAVSKIAKQDGRGLAVKLVAFEFNSPESTVKELLATAELLNVGPENCDVILDFEAFDRLPADLHMKDRAASTITESIDALESIRPRSVTVSGSSIPERVGKQYDTAPLKTRRLELEIWKDIQGRNRSRNIGFGDYGIVYAFQSDGGAPVQPPCRVRISAEDSHYLYRSPPNTYRNLRSRVRRDGVLRDLPDCWGRRGIIGQGNSFTGAGNATSWVAWDTNLHLEGTARIVRRVMRYSDADETAADELDKWPWLQTELGIVEES
jgi:hypothetical protein